MVKKTLKIYCFIICLVSCTEPIDFNQAEDIELAPIQEASLIFFEAPASEFFIGGEEVSQSSDFVETNIFRGDFIKENLEKAEFVFEIINSINRSYQVEVDFFNDFGQLEHSLTLSSAASSTNADVFTKYTEVFQGSSLTALLRTVRLEFTLTMLPGVTINDDTPGRINLQSKGVFYFNIKP